MKKTTGTSVARKVLCSALSAAMVVAFAPAVGAAVGSDDGAAYAAEGEQGQSELIDISKLKAEGGEGGAGYWVSLSSSKLWNDQTVEFPTAKLMLAAAGEDAAVNSEEVDASCYQVESGVWYQRTGENTYAKLGAGESIQTDRDYYIAVNGIEDKGYTGTIYAGVRYADSKNLNEYDRKLSKSMFWSDEAFKVPELTLSRTIDGNKVELDKDAYAVDTANLEKIDGNSTSQVAVPESGPLGIGEYYLVAKANADKGYRGSIHAWLRVLDADDLDHFNYDLSSWSFWSDKAAKIPEVTLRKGWDEDSQVISKDMYTVSDKWFKKDTTGSGEEGQEAYVEATPTDGKLEPGEYYIEVKLKKEGTKPRYIPVTVEDADDLERYDPELDGPSLWSDAAVKIPAVKLGRDVDDKWEYLDTEKYSVDDKWYTETEGSEGYAEVAPKDGKLTAGTYYVKVTMGNRDLYVPVKVNDAADASSYDFEPVYDRLWTDGAIAVPDVCGEREVDGQTNKLDPSRYAVDKAALYALDDDKGTVEDAYGNKYAQVSLSTGSAPAPGEYYVKVTANNKVIMCPVWVKDAADIANYYTVVPGEDGLYSGAKAEVPEIALARDVNGTRQQVDNTGGRAFAAGKLMVLKPGAEDDEPSDDALVAYTKATLDAGTYYVKLTGKGSYKGTKFAEITVLDNYDLGDYYAWAGGQDIWSDRLPSISSLEVNVSTRDDSNILDPGAYTIDTSTWYAYDEDSDEYAACETPTKGGSYYVKVTGKFPYKGTCYAHVWVSDVNSLGDYTTVVSADVSVGASAASVAAGTKLCREIDGKEEALFEGEDYTVEGRWYREVETPEGYEAISGNPTEAGVYYLKAVPAQGSNYTGAAYINVLVGNPCEEGHALRKVEATESTCTVHGHSAYWYCEKCDKIFSDENGEHEISKVPELSFAEHAPDGGTIVAAATCTTGGKIEYRCKKCGAVTSTTTTAALGHNFSSGSISWTGGGTSSATGTFTCSRDPSHKETVTASISKTLTVKPTCTAKGTNTYTATATSSTGAKVTSTKTVQDEPALGHAYGPYTITVQPTATTTGVATAKCTHDGCTSTITKTVEKLKSEQKTSVSGGASATATVTDAKPSTTPNGTNVVGSVTIDSVTAPASATKIEVPETVTVNGAEYAVTAIDAKAIAGNTKVESVKLPATVTELPSGLFEGCSSLKEATLPSKVTEIPADTFNGTALASVAVPATVTKIGARAFKGTALASVELPASVASVGKDAFKGCDKLVAATLPAALKAVPAGAFDGCSALKGVSLAGVKPLAATAAAPTTVDVSSATTIGANAFRGCKQVTAVDASAAKTIGAGAFKGTSKLSSLKTGSSLKSMGASAFSGAKRLKTLAVTSKKLAKGGVKGALKGSAVKTVKVAVSGSKATKAKYAAKYKKIFTAKNCGKKVAVK